MGRQSCKIHKESLIMSNPLISVIVPVYKVERFLPTCIESVQRQSYFNWELILVDDGSPDGCPQICDEYASHDDRIKVIHKENGRVAKARNAALRIARGGYVAFLDGDDYLHKDFLNVLYKLIVAQNADIVQCGFVKGTETVFPDVKVNENVTIYDNHSVFLKQKAKIVVWGKLYKRNIFDGRLVTEDKFFEDDFTTWKWYYAAKKIAITNVPLYYYMDNQQSTMAMHKKKPNWDFVEAYDERIGFFVDKKEEDMEHCSRMQLCKAMVLSYGNPYLSNEERQMVKNRFNESYRFISSSEYLPSSIKFVFWLFHHFPKLASKLAAKK